MKYTASIEIALPRERVVQLLADPEHLPKWLHGLVLREPLSGVHGQVGATSRVVMRMGRRHFDREIVAKGMWSAVRDRLIEAGPEKTLWESERTSGTRSADRTRSSVSGTAASDGLASVRPVAHRGRLRFGNAEPRAQLVIRQ